MTVGGEGADAGDDFRRTGTRWRRDRRHGAPPLFLSVALLAVGSGVGALERLATPDDPAAPPLVTEPAAVVGTVAAVAALVTVGGTSYGHWSPGYVVPRAAAAGAAVAVL